MVKWSSSSQLGASVEYGELDSSVTDVIIPVGAVIPWAKSLTGVPSLPAGWVECDGSAISDAASPMNGQNTPDLNSTQGFVRGAATSGTTGGADTHLHTVDTADITQSNAPDGAAAKYHFNKATPDTDTSSTLPVYVEMVWIMRIK